MRVEKFKEEIKKTQKKAKAILRKSQEKIKNIQTRREQS